MSNEIIKNGDYDENWPHFVDWGGRHNEKDEKLTGVTHSNQNVKLTSENTLYMVPNSHIDTGWMWPYQYTVEEMIGPSYKRAITALESNPNYTYAASAAKHYEWLKEYFPEEWEKVKEFIKRGQWDYPGGQLVESDLNLTGGESLVRNCLYGQRWFEKEFGKMSTLAYVPDTFGFSGQFPQIIKKSGMDYFLTSKLTWNDVNSAGPTDIFWWTGIDGDPRNEVLSYTLISGYNLEVIAGEHDWRIHYTFGRNITTGDTGISKALILFGTGDMGGGPVLEGKAGDWKADQDRAGNRYTDPALINEVTEIDIKMSTATEFFEDVYDEMIKYRDNERFRREGEMYLEFHRGTYTSWSRMKKNNRQNEILAETAEKAATLSFWSGAIPSNSKNEIELAWDNLSLTSFHDVLPGTSSPYTYWVTFNKHEMVKNLLTNVQSNALLGMAYQADVKDIAGIPVLVYNALSWKRDGEVTVELKINGDLPDNLTIKDGVTELPSKELRRDEKANTITVRFKANDVPALGYKVFSVETADSLADVESDLRLLNDHTMQNKYFTLTLNPETGYISSLYDRVNDREVFSKDDLTEANGLHVYFDSGFEDCYGLWGYNYEAWDLMPMEINKEPEIFFDKNAGISLHDNSSEKITFKIKKTYKDSTVYQYISMYPGIDRVDIRMELDWMEKDHLLKVSFPVLVDASKANYEIAYGAISRSTTRDTDYDRARFEQSGHKWMDVTADDESYGVSIFNDAKYGYDVLKRGNGTTDKRLREEGIDIPTYVRSRITVVRSPIGASVVGPGAPRDNVDLGYQCFNYSIYPHAGRWQDAGTVNKAYEFNYPMQAIQAPKEGGGQSTSFSYLSSDKNNVIISTVKNPQDSSGEKDKLIVRVFESTGVSTNNVTLTLPADIIAAKEVNLLEYEYPDGHVYQGGKKLQVSGKNISFDIGKFEILTLEITMKPTAGQCIDLKQEAIDLSGYFNMVAATKNSNRTSVDGSFDETYSLPAEHWPSTVDYQGVIFENAKNGEDKIFVEARGQNVCLNDLAGKSYNTLYLLGVSAGKEKPSGEFKVDYTDGTFSSKFLSFANWRTDLSGWDQWEKKDTKPFVYDSIAHVFTHFHNSSPDKDEATMDNYLFVYSIDVDPEKDLKSITLPSASGIKIAAITAVKSSVASFPSVNDVD